MTESELKQLFYLKRETERLQSELQRLEIELEDYDGYKGNRLSHTPRGGSRIAVYEKLVEMLDDKQILNDAIRLNLARIQRERIKLERYIGGIEDAQTRLIFRLRHINGMTWAEIGAEMHMNRTTAMRKYREYLKIAHYAH